MNKHFFWKWASTHLARPPVPGAYETPHLRRSRPVPQRRRFGLELFATFLPRRRAAVAFERTRFEAAALDEATDGLLRAAGALREGGISSGTTAAGTSTCSGSWSTLGGVGSTGGAGGETTCGTVTVADGGGTNAGGLGGSLRVARGARTKATATPSKPAMTATMDEVTRGHRGFAGTAAPSSGSPPGEGGWGSTLPPVLTSACAGSGTAGAAGGSRRGARKGSRVCWYIGS